MAQDPPPPASLFFDSKPFGDPHQPVHFDLQVTELEPSASHFITTAPEASAATPAPRPEEAARASPRPKEEERRHAPRVAHARAKPPSLPERRSVEARPAPSHTLNARQATREARSSEDADDRKLKTGRSVAVLAHVRPVLIRRRPPSRLAGPEPRDVSEARVPVVALPASLLPTRP